MLYRNRWCQWLGGKGRLDTWARQRDRFWIPYHPHLSGASASEAAWQVRVLEFHKNWFSVISRWQSGYWDDRVLGFQVVWLKTRVSHKRRILIQTDEISFKVTVSDESRRDGKSFLSHWHEPWNLLAYGLYRLGNGHGEATVFYRVITPSIKSSNIQLAILGMKITSHYSGQKISLKRNDCSLGADTCSVPKNQVMCARSVA